MAVGGVGITEPLRPLSYRTWSHEDEVWGKVLGQPRYSFLLVWSEDVQHELVDSFRERCEMAMSGHQGIFAEAWHWMPIIRIVPVGDEAFLVPSSVDRVFVDGPTTSSAQR